MCMRSSIVLVFLPPFLNQMLRYPVISFGLFMTGVWFTAILMYHTKNNLNNSEHSYYSGIYVSLVFLNVPGEHWTLTCISSLFSCTVVLLQLRKSRLEHPPYLKREDICCCTHTPLNWTGWNLPSSSFDWHHDHWFLLALLLKQFSVSELLLYFGNCQMALYYFFQ